MMWGGEGRGDEEGGGGLDQCEHHLQPEHSYCNRHDMVGGFSCLVVVELEEALLVVQGYCSQILANIQLK